MIYLVEKKDMYTLQAKVTKLESIVKLFVTVCDECNGSGEEFTSHRYTCTKCDGVGYFKKE